MKAYVLHNINDFRYEDVHIPEIPNGWALVQVKVAGICSSDVSRVYTKGTYHFPTIPGHEFSGIVHSVSSNYDSKWIGKRVGIFPLIPCRECEQCNNKKYEMCSNYDYIGSRRDGAFAEYVAVPIWNLIELSDNISYEVAAMLEPLSVGLHAIKIADIKRDDTVAIIGTGMIGISAAQWVKKYTNNAVVVIGRSESKRCLVEKTGVKYEICNSSKLEYDVVIEAVGTPQSIEQAIQMTSPGGTIVLMGNPSGDILLSQDIYWKILRKQLILKGTWNSAYDGINLSDWTDSIEALSKGEINVNSLISHKLQQDKLIEGLELMKEHSEPYCKVIVEFNT